MTGPNRATIGQVTPNDVRLLCGDILDWKISAIVGTGATVEDLEEAIAWVSGQTDEMGEARKSLSGMSAVIYDILNRDEDISDEQG